jgi:hypothetical protein
MRICKKISNFLHTYRDIQGIKSREILYPDRDSEKAELLLDHGYVTPFTTKVVLWGNGSTTLEHYVLTEKGRKFDKLTKFLKYLLPNL